MQQQIIKVVNNSVDYSTSSVMVSEVQLTYQTNISKENRVRITDSNVVGEILHPHFQEIVDYRERFYALYLNKANECVGLMLVAEGGINSVVVDIRIAFQGALRTNASAVIIAHNHPSGNLMPSQADILLTRKIKEAGKVLDIPILDHLIITSDGYYSFADEGMM